MPGSILLCADGSEVSSSALQSGVAIMRPDADVIIATVIPDADPMLVTGTGFAGGTMSPEAYEAYERGLDADAHVVLQQVADLLGIDASKGVVLRGDAGATLCAFADDQGVEAIIIGSRGHGGFKRALLGSVSDYVVRNAHCPVVVA